MNELIEKYFEQFGEDFPLMRFLGVPEDKVKSLIQGCIDSGEPYDPDEERGIPNDAVY